MTTNAKEIIFEEPAREFLSKGIKTLTDVVAYTLGPKGRNVGIEKAGAPQALLAMDAVLLKTLL